MTELICIVCPKGCHLCVDEADGFKVNGAGCPRGEAYGYKELTHPTRTLTSVVKIDNAMFPCCPVKTSADIPRTKIPEAMALLKDARLTAPAAIGDVVVTDICGTGVNWIVTRSCPCKRNNGRE